MMSSNVENVTVNTPSYSTFSVQNIEIITEHTPSSGLIDEDFAQGGVEYVGSDTIDAQFTT